MLTVLGQAERSRSGTANNMQHSVLTKLERNNTYLEIEKENAQFSIYVRLCKVVVRIQRNAQKRLTCMNYHIIPSAQL